MRMVAVGALSSAWLVGAMGCGGAASSNDVGTPTTASAFCQQEEALLTEALMRCYGGTTAQWPIYMGESTCPLLDGASTNQRLTYDPTKAAACLNQLATPLACSADTPQGHSCVTSVLVGAVADGEPCESSYVCHQGSVCTTAETIADSCPVKTCWHIPVVGDKCDPLAYCSNATCDGQTCVPLARVGDPCGTVNGVCGQNLYCATGDPNPTCKRAVENGPCPDGLGCFDYQYCDSTRHCHARLELGGDCSGDPSSCQTFTACDPTTHRCIEASHVGQLCGNLLGSQFLCQGGACVLDTAQVYECIVPAAEGAACANNFECMSGLCASGTCASQPPNDGAPCTDSTLCASGDCSADGVCGDSSSCLNAALCTSGICAGGVCVARAADGAACASGADCLSGHCAKGQCAPCM